MRATQFVTEIDRLASHDYTGGKDELRRYRSDTQKLYKLPGGSRFLYYFNGRTNSDSFSVQIVDPEAEMDEPDKYAYTYGPRGAYEKAMKKWKDAGGKGNKVVGKLSVYEYKKFPAPNAYRVGAITVDEDYRGQGLAMALYGVIINVLKISLIAGDSQTPGGRRNWMNLASIPGCEVIGYLTVSDKRIKTDKVPKKGGQVTPWERKGVKKHNESSGKMIDRIMMLGGEYLGPYKKYGDNYHVFTYPVTTGETELKNAVKKSDVSVYTGDYDNDRIDTGLIARWVG